MSTPSHVSIQDLRQALISLREVGQLEVFLQETFQNDVSKPGAMSDSSKRRAEAIESDNEFDLISSVSCKQAPVLPCSSAAMSMGTENVNNGYPEGIVSLEQWGHTVCELPKVANRDINYMSMIEESKTKKEMGEYLSWVYNTKIQSKKADDLRAYLKAVHWNPKTHRVEAGETMMYPGSTMARRLK